MRQLVTIILTILTMTLFAQPKGYTTLDYTFEYHSNEFKNHQLNGNIKTLMVYKKSNNNFHSKNLTIKLDSGMLDCHKYFIDSLQICETQFLNSDGTLSSKRIFKNGLIQEFAFYQPNGIIQNRDIFTYNDLGQLVEKIMKDDNNYNKHNVKYNYDEKNRLESVIGNENYNYKFIYDKRSGFYEVKFSEYNGMLTIHEIRYNSYSDTEILNVILQNEPNIKFEDVENLEKVWQSISRLDNYNRVIFEQSKDLKLDEIQIESSFLYNADNQLVSKVFKTKNGTNDTYTFIYRDKKLIRQFANDETGLENFNQLLDYNEYGDIIKKHNVGLGIKEETYTYAYTYDNKNNWIEKKEIVNGKLFEITYRKIEYEE